MINLILRRIVSGAFLVSLFSITISTQAAITVQIPPELRNVTVTAIAPDYPLEARAHRLQGSGLALLKIDQQTGKVISATLLTSTGHKILDDAALSAFRNWRFKSGTISAAKVPITFVMNAAANMPLVDKHEVTYAVKPEYPYEARANHLTGSGILLMNLDPHSGQVTSARVLKSTGHKILDEAALKAFRQWRFKPGAAPEVKVPITYSMNPVVSHNKPVKGDL